MMQIQIFVQFPMDCLMNQHILIKNSTGCAFNNINNVLQFCNQFFFFLAATARLAWIKLAKKLIWLFEKLWKRSYFILLFLHFLQNYFVSQLEIINILKEIALIELDDIHMTIKNRNIQVEQGIQLISLRFQTSQLEQIHRARNARAVPIQTD